MITVKTNTDLFEKTMNNIVDYSFGFLNGINQGKSIFLKNLGSGVIEAIGNYVDVMARSNPKALHHIYEWNNVGSASSRLFTLHYSTAGGLGIAIGARFRQSRSVSGNMTRPFYDKARIMEEGISVKIVPQKNKPLRFESGGAEVFTKKPVTINNPGGSEVKGSFKDAVDNFVRLYLKQSFLKSSGLYEYLGNPVVYKNNLKAGSRSGIKFGSQIGFMWISKAIPGVD